MWRRELPRWAVASAVFASVFLAGCTPAERGGSGITEPGLATTGASSTPVAATSRPSRTATVAPRATPTPALTRPWSIDTRVTPVSLEDFALCRLPDLAAFQVEGQGAGGGMWDSVGVVNRGTEPCLLAGAVSTELIGDADGTEAPATHDSAAGRPVLLPPTRAPFEAHIEIPVMALVTFNWSTWPETCPSKTFLPFTGALVRFEQIGALPQVALLGRHSACAERGVAVSSIRLSGPYAWPAPWKDAELDLLPELGIVRFELPEGYSYQLRLTNQGHAPLLPAEYCVPFIQVFQPVPTTQFAGSSKVAFAQKVEMSGCDSMSPLPPGESVEFEIRFEPPPGATGGYQLLWLSVGADEPYFNTSRETRFR